MGNIVKITRYSLTNCSHNSKPYKKQFKWVGSNEGISRLLSKIVDREVWKFELAERVGKLKANHTHPLFVAM